MSDDEPASDVDPVGDVDPVRMTPPSAAPPPWRVREGRMISLFDVGWMLGAIVAWGPAGLGFGWTLKFGFDALGWPGGFLLLPVAYLVFLFVLVLTVGGIAFALPSPTEGTSKVFVDRPFFIFLLHWGLEKYVPPPLLSHIQLITGLRTLYYRLRGTKIAWSTHVSPGAVLFGPSLLRLGHLTYIGDGANVATHLSQGDKLVQAPVVIGDRCSLGAHVNVGPGCTFGADVRVGALCDIAPGAWIEDDAEIGPACQFGMGVKIGKGAKIEPRTFLASWTTVPPGEVWGGDPGKKLGMISMSKGALRRRQRRRIGG